MEEIIEVTNFTEFNDFYVPYFESTFLILKYTLFGISLLFGALIILIAVRSWNQ